MSKFVFIFTAILLSLSLAACASSPEAQLSPDKTDVPLKNTNSAALKANVSAKGGNPVGGGASKNNKDDAVISYSDASETARPTEKEDTAPADSNTEIDVKETSPVYEPLPIEKTDDTIKIPTKLTPEDEPVEPLVPEPAFGVILSVSAQYVRTYAMNDAASYPVTCVIHSAEELRQYYDNNRSTFNLESCGEGLGFLDMCSNYDDAYFAENDLVIIVLQESSGSVRHEVTGVCVSGDDITIDILRKVPDVGTCDMAQWHILVEVPSGIADGNIELVFD